VPNQGAVMLWQAVCSAAIGLSITLAETLRRLQPHKQHPLPADVDAETIDASFTKGVLTAPLPKNSAAPEKKIEAAA
jgi:HSP20 family molecular chaperone IbpA